MDYLRDLRCEENLRDAYLLAQHVVEGYGLHLENSQKPALTPFWALRLTERLTLALYLERSSNDLLSANQMLSYTSGSKLLEAAARLREESLIPPAVDELLAPLRLADDARVSFRTTALAYDALGLLEEKNLDSFVKPELGNWS